MKILLVDDEKLFLDFLSKMIRMFGHEVILAEDGKHALEKLKKELEKKSSVDAIITDLMMPNINGIGLTRAAKEMNPEIVVIMVSASFDDNSKKAAIEAGVRFTFEKTSKDLLPNILGGISCSC